jgi:hypothetical protein
MPAIADEDLTPRQRAARANGARSRGPVTAAGKSRSAMNALRHGLRAARAVVLASEDEGAYLRLGALLELDLRPVGAMEGALVERIANALWRLRRAERMETIFLERALVTADAPGADPLACLDDRRLGTLLRYQAHLRSELHRAHGALRRAQRERRAAEAQERTARAGRHGAAPTPRGTPERTNEPTVPDPHGLGRAAAALGRDPALAGYGRAEVARAFAGILGGAGRAKPPDPPGRRPGA